jgi:hypothetical protein
VTNTGPSVVFQDLGVSPGSSITGFGPGIVLGTIHNNDAVAAQGQADALTAYGIFAGLAPTQNLTGQDLGGLTLDAGVYKFDSSAQLTGALTLDFQGSNSPPFYLYLSLIAYHRGQLEDAIEQARKWREASRHDSKSTELLEWLTSEGLKRTIQ